MSEWIFWDVDTQHDFMRAGGRLYVPDAEDVIPNLEALTDHAHAEGIRIVASADDHRAGDPELSDAPDFEETFPPHCMRGTPGQRKIPETTLVNALVIEPETEDDAALRRRVRAHRGDILFHKHWFDVFTNPNVEPVLNELDPSAIVLYGVALDVCNRFAVEGILARRPHARLYVVTDATKPIAADKAEGLLSGWRDRGVQLVTTAAVLRVAKRREEVEEPQRV